MKLMHRGHEIEVNAKGQFTCDIGDGREITTLTYHDCLIALDAIDAFKPFDALIVRENEVHCVRIERVDLWSDTQRCFPYVDHTGERHAWVYAVTAETREALMELIELNDEREKFEASQSERAEKAKSRVSFIQAPLQFAHQNNALRGFGLPSEAQSQTKH